MNLAGVISVFILLSTSFLVARVISKNIFSKTNHGKNVGLVFLRFGILILIGIFLALFQFYLVINSHTYSYIWVPTLFAGIYGGLLQADLSKEKPGFVWINEFVEGFFVYILSGGTVISAIVFVMYLTDLMPIRFGLW